MYRSFLALCTCPSFDFFAANPDFKVHCACTKEGRFYFCAQKEATVFIWYLWVFSEMQVMLSSAQERGRQAWRQRTFLSGSFSFSHSAVPAFLLPADQYDAGKPLQEGRPGALLGDELQRGAEAVSLGPGCHPRWVSALSVFSPVKILITLL